MDKKKPPTQSSTSDPYQVAVKMALSVYIFAVIAVGFYIWNFRKQVLSDDSGSWGEFGDFMGGVINPFVGIVTVFLIVINIRLQREELRASLAELKRSNESTTIQSFEQSLFAWLANYHGLVAAIRDATGASGREAMQLWYTSQFSSRAVYAHSLGKKDVTSADVSLGHQILMEGLPDMTGCDEIDDSLREELDDFYAAAVIAYDDVYRRQIVNLDAALRTVYRLIRWIDRSEIADTKRWHYVALVRAQLSWIEMVYMFYNGATVVGEKFVDLANRYALFDNLEPGGDFIVGYAMYKARAEVQKGVKMAYNRTAFNSAQAKEQRGLGPDA